MTRRGVIPAGVIPFAARYIRSARSRTSVNHQFSGYNYVNPPRLRGDKEDSTVSLRLFPAALSLLQGTEAVLLTSASGAHHEPRVADTDVHFQHVGTRQSAELMYFILLNSPRPESKALIISIQWPGPPVSAEAHGVSQWNAAAPSQAAWERMGCNILYGTSVKASVVDRNRTKSSSCAV